MLIFLLILKALQERDSCSDLMVYLLLMLWYTELISLATTSHYIDSKTLSSVSNCKITTNKDTSSGHVMSSPNCLLLPMLFTHSTSVRSDKQ